MSVKIRPILALGIAAILAGCAGSLPARSIDEGAKLEFAQGEAAIFGRILVTADGQKVDKRSIFNVRPGLTLKSSNNNQRSHHPFQIEDGRFLVVLPVGSYELDYIYPPLVYSVIQPALRFNVVEEGKVYYIGTVVIHYTTWFFGAYIDEIESIEVMNELDIERQ